MPSARGPAAIAHDPRACRCCARASRSASCVDAAARQAVHRQADRAAADLRGPGGHRDRERPAVRGGRGAHAGSWRARSTSCATAQDRLVQTEKLASLGQLTAGIAHEIKNPLNFVNNFAALSAELIDELARRSAGARSTARLRDGDRRARRRCSRAISRRSCSTAGAPTPSSRTCCSTRARARASTGRSTSTPSSRRA